jgi:hypothetical protein
MQAVVLCLAGLLHTRAAVAAPAMVPGRGPKSGRPSPAVRQRARTCLRHRGRRAIGRACAVEAAARQTVLAECLPTQGAARRRGPRPGSRGTRPRCQRTRTRRAAALPGAAKGRWVRGRPRRCRGAKAGRARAAVRGRSRAAVRSRAGQPPGTARSRRCRPPVEGRARAAVRGHARWPNRRRGAAHA